MSLLKGIFFVTLALLVSAVTVLSVLLYVRDHSSEAYAGLAASVYLWSHLLWIAHKETTVR